MNALSPNPIDQTNTLLVLLLMGANNGTLTSRDLNPPFTPPPGIVRQNCFFFASLFASLLAAAGAVLAKQWLANYERTGQTGPLDEQGLRRTAKYRGAEKWRLQHVVEGLPTLILVSLGLFFAAITDYIWSINHEVASIVLALSLLGTLSYIAMLLAAAIYPQCPYQTAPSTALVSIYGGLRQYLPRTLVAVSKYTFFVPITRILDVLSNLSIRTTSPSSQTTENETLPMESADRAENEASSESEARTNAHPIPNRLAHASKELSRIIASWGGRASQLSQPLARKKVVVGHETEHVMVEAALSMFEIAPRDEVLLAVAWNAPTISDIRNLGRILNGNILRDIVAHLRTTLGSSAPQMEDRALV